MPNSNNSVNENDDYINKNVYKSDNDKPAYEIWYQSEQEKVAELERIQPPITNIYEHLYQIPPIEGEIITLASLSDSDSVWDVKRHNTELVADIYGYHTEFGKYHERMSDCSTYLLYAFNDDGIKLTDARFCRVRYCPVCQWRRSMLWKHNMYVAYDQIKEQYPTHRWLFLTLTVKNCDITDLRDTLQVMNESWRRLIKRIEFIKGVEGWIRTTEVTRPKDIRDKDKKHKRICPITGNTHAHPHFHIMLLVKPSYFAKNYIKQNRWGELWGECLRVDYVPVVDIRKVKAKKNTDDTPDNAIKSAIMETLKYSVKPDDMIGDGSMKSNMWFYELTRQCFKLRFVASGGALKDAIKSDATITDDDLIAPSGDDDNANDDARRLMFSYQKSSHNYIYNSGV